MITNIRPNAAEFGRLVDHLVSYAQFSTGETTVVAGSTVINVYAGLSGHLVLTSFGKPGETSTEYRRRVCVVPGVVMDSTAALAVTEQRTVMGEFRGWHAAVSFALDLMCAPS